MKIFTAAGVFSSQCTPCHPDRDGFKNPKIIFRHGYHLLMRCDSCHPVFPHQQSGLVKPAMDLCYICHGINHGAQKSIANGKCGACHPPGFRKSPGSHTKSWKRSGHKKTTVVGSRSCMKCHTGSFCENCHRKKGVSQRPLDSYFFESELPSNDEGTSLIVEIGSKINQASCVPCHPDMDLFRNKGLIFRHVIHLSRGVECQACHEKYPHLPGGKTLRPTMESCYNCHGIVHGYNGEIAKSNCGACHPKGFKLVPSSHTKTWKLKWHRSDVKKDPAYCQMCHTRSLCERCHSIKKVKPADHKKREIWRRYHGKVTSDLSRCEICHKEKMCMGCHKTEIPHQVIWVSRHNKDGKKVGARCRMCHYERGYCSDCHHVRSLERRLVLATCIKCHPVLRKKPSIVRRSGPLAKGLLLHKYHFEMTKTKPFKCGVCHAGSIQKGKGCFSFALCYKCHGKYENGKLIAKWGGRELCYRCHPNQKR